MRNSDSLGQQMPGEDQNATKPAILLKQVRKEYRLYDSMADQALDVLGMSWLRFWRPIRYRAFAALDGIELNIGHGERVGIIGRNGAGKTTLLKLITRNFAPTSGEISIDGQVQALMQTGLGFHGEFTGLENIRAGLIYNGLTGDDLEAAIEDVIDFCELGDFLNQPIKTYSLGMRARLQFATATAIKPDIVIIDEVLGAGDAYFSTKSAERIERMASSGCTMLLVSHSMSQVIQFCDRAIWIRDGQIVGDGDVRQVVGDYEVFCTKLSDKDESANRLLKKFNETAQTDGALTVMLENGLEVHRWASHAGVKVTHFEFSDGVSATRDLQCKERITCCMQVQCEVAGKLSCVYFVTVFNAGGMRIATFESDIDTFVANPGDRRDVRFNADPLLLGPGDYFLNVSIFEMLGSNTKLGRRFDLLARFYPFRVHKPLDYREAPLVYHPAKWSFLTQACSSNSPILLNVSGDSNGVV